VRGDAERRTEARCWRGRSTLNRLKLTSEKADKTSPYKKIVADWEAMDKLLVELFLESYGSRPVVDVERPMIRCTGIRRGVSSMVITVTIAICRCISSAGISCSVPVCGRPMRTLPRGLLRSLLGW